MALHPITALLVIKAGVQRRGVKFSCQNRTRSGTLTVLKNIKNILPPFHHSNGTSFYAILLVLCLSWFSRLIKAKILEKSTSQIEHSKYLPKLWGLLKLEV